jgi:V/A-type H+-transporting ATPase subunit E
VLVPENTEKELSEFVKSKVISSLNQELAVTADKNIKYGFKIGPSDGSYLISFTEKDFDNLFKEYMRPRILELLLENK